MPFLSLAAAALLAQAAEAPPIPAGGGQPPVHVESQEATWDVGAGEARLKGEVLLRRGPLVLRAPEACYRPDSGQVEATGGVLLVDGARAIVARAIRGEVGGVFDAEAPAVFFVEDPAALAGAQTAEEAERVPRGRLTLRADHATGTVDGAITLTGARGTTCSCADGSHPTWELRASSADVRAGQRAILTWPVLWVAPNFVEEPFPIFALPWLWVPLGERQTGLLLPDLRSTGSTGPTISQPLFVTLGRSMDATVWAGWAFGPLDTPSDSTKPSVRGFDGALELRWAPAERSAGHLRLDWTQDLNDEPNGTDGARVALTGLHAQALGGRTGLRLELDLVGDALYVRDFSSDMLQRDATYRRSAFLLSHRFDDAVAEASGAWLIPLTRDGRLAGVDGLSFGLFGSGLPTFHRGPALAASLLPTPVVGGLLASGRAEVARFGPLSGSTSDSGIDGIGPGDLGWNPTLADPGQLDGRFDPGERLAATRALLRAELSLPILLGRWLRLTPAILGAASGYAFDAAVEPLANAWAVASATAETEITRRFGALRHAVIPRFAWRLGSGVSGGRLPAYGYDAWDRAAERPPGSDASFAGPRLLAVAPPGPFQQGRASVETRLDGPKGEILRFEAGQDLDLQAGTLAESFATLRASAGLVSAEGAVRYAGFAKRPPSQTVTPHELDDWTEARGTLRLRTGRGYDLHASVRSVGAGGSPAKQAGADALFDLRPTPLPMAAQADAGFRLPIGPATLGYDVLFPPRAVTVTACSSLGTRQVGAFHVQQQKGSFVWDSPCRCFRASLSLGYDDCGNLSYHAGIELSPAEPATASR